MERDQVKAILAKVTRKPARELAGHLSLQTLGLSNSFGLSALRGMLESQGRLKLPPLDLKLTVDDLCRMLEPGQQSAAGASPANPVPAGAVPGPAPERARRRPGLPGNLGLGMDMQEVEQFPMATDFRTDEFYSTHFTPAEISTSMLRPDPRLHLCGVFCAKEAVKKSHPDLLNVRMGDICIDHDAAGRPTLDLPVSLVDLSRFTFVLTITHTSRFAAATCITQWSDD